MIVIDVPGRRIDVEGADLGSRLRDVTCRRRAVELRGVMAKYAREVRSASEGAVTS